MSESQIAHPPPNTFKNLRLLSELQPNIFGHGKDAESLCFTVVRVKGSLLVSLSIHFHTLQSRTR